MAIYAVVNLFNRTDVFTIEIVWSLSRPQLNYSDPVYNNSHVFISVKGNNFKREPNKFTWICSCSLFWYISKIGWHDFLTLQSLCKPSPAHHWSWSLLPTCLAQKWCSKFVWKLVLLMEKFRLIGFLCITMCGIDGKICSCGKGNIYLFEISSCSEDVY